MKIEDSIKQKKFESAQHKANINLIYTFNWMMDNMNEIFKEFDITHQQYNVLRILNGKYPNEITAGEIKEVMLDKNPDLTRLSDRLLNKELITRGYNETNRRQVLIKITPKGIDLLKEIEPIMKKRGKNLNHLTESDANLLSDLLDKLRG